MKKIFFRIGSLCCAFEASISLLLTEAGFEASNFIHINGRVFYYNSPLKFPVTFPNLQGKNISFHITTNLWNPLFNLRSTNLKNNKTLEKILQSYTERQQQIDQASRHQNDCLRLVADLLFPYPQHWEAFGDRLSEIFDRINQWLDDDTSPQYNLLYEGVTPLMDDLAALQVVVKNGVQEALSHLWTWFRNVHIPLRPQDKDHIVFILNQLGPVLITEPLTREDNSLQE